MIVTRAIEPLRILRAVGLALLLLLSYDVAVTLIYVALHQTWIGVENLPLALLGSALAIIVGLRNNSAYARWWEARTLWGQCVNNSRSLARGALMLLPHDNAEAVIRLQIAWAHALRLALWRQDPWPEMSRLLPPDIIARLRHSANLATALQGEIGKALASATSDSVADLVRLAALDATLTALANAQGGLERIKNTPLPRQFEQFPRVFVVTYCLMLPIGLVHDLGIITPIGSTVIGSAFYLLDQIGRDLEDPFAGSPHDIAMTAITRTIEVDLKQMLGERDAPKALEPVDGVLL